MIVVRNVFGVANNEVSRKCRIMGVLCGCSLRKIFKVISSYPTSSKYNNY